MLRITMVQMIGKGEADSRQKIKGGFLNNSMLGF